MGVLNKLFRIIHSKFAFFISKGRFFVKMLMKFCRNFTNMPQMSIIFKILKKKIKFCEKSVKILEMFKLFRKLFSFFSRVPTRSWLRIRWREGVSFSGCYEREVKPPP